MKNQKSENKEILGLLPVNILNSKNFTPKCKYLIATLLYLNGMDKVAQDGFFFRTNTALASESSMTEANLLINLRKLVLMNLITRKAGKRNEASEYRIDVEAINSYEDSNKKTKKYTIDKSNNSNNNSNKSNNSNEVCNSNNNSNSNSNKVDDNSLNTNNLEDTLLTKTNTIAKLNNSNGDNLNNSTDTEKEKETEIEIEKENYLKYYIELYIKDFSEKIERLEKTIETNNSVLNDKLDMILFSINNNNNNNVNNVNSEANNTPMTENKTDNKIDIYEASANATADSILNSEKIVSPLTTTEGEKENTSTQEENTEANNTPTSTTIPFSSSVLNDYTNCEQVSTQEETMLENAGKEVKIVNNAEGLVQRLSQVTSIAELNHKAQLYVNWLDNNADSVSDSTYTQLSKLVGDKYEELFDYLTSSTPTNTPTSTETSFSSSGLNDNVKYEEVPTLEEIMLENAGKQVIEDDKEDDFFSSIFSTPSKITATVTKDSSVGSKMVKVIATGEIITVADVVKRGLGIDDVCDVNSSAISENSSVTENSSNQVADNEGEIHCNSSETKENSSVNSSVTEVGSKKVQVIATGEIITVADVVKRGLGVDDVCDVNSNNSNSNKSNNSNSNNNSNQEAVTEEITPNNSNDLSNSNSNNNSNNNSNKRRKVTPPAGDYLVKVGGKSIRLDEFSFTPTEDFLSILSA